MVKKNVQNTMINVVSTAVVLIIVGIIVLDGYAIWKDQAATDTVSAHLRNWNAASGGLLALVVAALWIHLFVSLPQSWQERNSSPFLELYYRMSTPKQKRRRGTSI